MARNKGTFNFAANFQVKMQEALDPRLVVSAKADLITKETWPYDGDTLYLYEGMIVGVVEESAAYMLVDIDKALSSDYSGWIRIDAGEASQVEIVDNLTSDNTDKALSARQGKVLMNEVTTLSGKLSGVYTYKGSVASYTELPSDNLTAGDVYNVEAEYDGNPAGTNYAWTGTEWDALSGIVDLSNFYTKDEVDGLLVALETSTNSAIGQVSTNAASALEKANSALEQANSNKTSLEAVSKSLGEINLILNGEDDDETDGVVGRLAAVEEKNNSQDTRLTNLEKLVSGGEAGEGNTTLLEMVNANTAALASLEPRVEANEEAIALLNGNAQTEGSVDYKIEHAFAWEEVE